MPELPEVEVTLRGIAPRLTGRVITGVAVREPRLRWRVQESVKRLAGREIRALRRRGKYLLFDCGGGNRAGGRGGRADGRCGKWRKAMKWLTTAVLIAVAAAAWAGDDSTTTVKDQTALAVTIYNGDLALVKDARRVRLDQGESRLAWIDSGNSRPSR